MTTKSPKTLRNCGSCRHFKVYGKAWQKRRARCLKKRACCYVGGPDFFERIKEPKS